MLQDDPAFTGSYFGYEPNADGKDLDSLAALPPEAMNADGRFIPYWFRNNERGGAIELKPLVLMDGLYYQGVKDAFAATKKAASMVTEPYDYEGEMIVEQTYPIIIDGEFMGVAGVDRSLTDLENGLDRLSEAEKE